MHPNSLKISALCPFKILSHPLILGMLMKYKIHYRIKKKLGIQWISGHSGITGNERSDQIVKLVIQMQQSQNWK